MRNNIQAEGLSGYSPGQRPGETIPSSHQALKGRNMGFIMKGFQPKTPVMPTTQGVAPGYIILGFQPIFYPKQRGYAMDKRMKR